MSRDSRLRAFVERDPLNPILLCDLLDELLAEGRVDDALAQLRASPSEMRTLPAVRFREARCALVHHDFLAVAALLQPLMDQVAGVPAGIAHDLAYAQFALGHLDDALQVLAATQPQGEDAVAVAVLKARIYYQQLRYDDALDVLQPITDGPRLAEALGLRAILLLDKGEMAEASSAAGQALGINPMQYEAMIVRGTVALEEQQLELSQAVFEQVLTVDPHSGRALLGMGENQMLRAAVPEARALIERASEEMPQHIGTWHALAWCQLLEGDLQGAARSFERAFAIDRTFGETHGGMALVSALRGERRAAEESIKRAMRLAPHGLSARYAQSVLLLDAGQPEAAQEIVDSILQQPTRHTMGIPADFVFKLRELVRPRG
ncbi:MAG: tetratricopeptide repeat protein [Rhodanobacter sp.]